MKKLGYTVNDVLVSALVGGIKRYTQNHKQEFDIKHLPHVRLSPLSDLLRATCGSLVTLFALSWSPFLMTRSIPFMVTNV